MRVAFAGEPGSFAEDAVLAYFGAAAVPSTIALGGFREVAERVAGARDVDVGVLPIENLVGGTVVEVQDLLLGHPLRIVGEVVVPVRLCLAALPGESLDSIERVYSHSQALGQADRFLRSRPWSLLTTYNTAGSGRMIAERRERRAAAVLSPRAARLFGLEVLAEGIQSVPDNRTRFVVVAAEGVVPPAAAVRGGDGPMRTTLVIATRNEPGALYRCLAVFADAGLNMSKLESRPSRDRPWEYVFWIELDADARAPETAEALDRLARVAASVRLVGSYPRYEEPPT